MSCRCSRLDTQVGGRRVNLEHADAVETTRTVRESADRSAAVATSSVTALTGTGNTGGLRMHLPEVHRVAAQSTTDNIAVPQSQVDTKTKPEIGRLSIEVAESKRCFGDGCRSNSARFSDTEERCRPRPETASSTVLPELTNRCPVLVQNGKPTCREPVNERFDRVVQYFDSRQSIPGKSGHYTYQR